MTWTWSYDPADTDADLPAEFTNQSDAESWLGESWRALADAGVIGVTLYEDGKKCYGPMPLSE